MSATTTTQWQIRGEEVVSCNCAWGCPCQFNALPTSGQCEALAAWQIHEGHYGDVKLDGVRFANIYWWPGAVHEGNGIRQMIIDSQATAGQRQALLALESGNQGGAYFEIFAAVCPNALEPVSAPITFQADRERRQVTVQIPEIGEMRVEPIKNPVTGEEHRARINLPNGFEYKTAEVADAVDWWVRSGDKLAFAHRKTHAQLNAFDWSNQ